MAKKTKSAVCVSCPYRSCNGCAVPPSQRLNVTPQFRDDLGVITVITRRKNIYAQECVCCGLMVDPGEGLLAKISADDATWCVICNGCRQAGGTIKVQEPIAITHELNVYGEIIKAGESFWESNKHQMVLADPKSVRPGASLDELYLGAKYNGRINWSDPKAPPSSVRGQHVSRVIIDDPHNNSDVPPGWKRVENINSWPKRMFGPVKAVHREAAKPGFRWADGPSAPSERGSMLGAGWGGLPASTQRKHKTKRPKRIGW
jgi:hypothetical protein